MAAVVGALPMSLIYALIGAHAAGFERGGFALGTAILVGGSTWILAQGLGARRAPNQHRAQTDIN
jgi:hypothetical protein